MGPCDEGNISWTPILRAFHLLPQHLPRRPLCREAWRAFPRGARRARGRVLHPARVERRPLAAFVVTRELEAEALVGHSDRVPARTRPSGHGPTVRGGA